MVTNNSDNIPTAASGKYLQGAGVGTAPAFSTATLPSTATGTGTILRADGTNWSATTATYPNTAGTSGNVLTSDGTNWVSSASGTGLVKLSTATASSSASISFDNTLITSTYKTYLVVFDSIVAASGSTFKMLVSANNGSVYQSTGYLSGNFYFPYNGAITGNQSSTTFFQLFTGGGNPNQNSGTLWIYNLATTNSTSVNGDFWVGSTYWQKTIGNQSTASINNIQFIFDSGNIASGTITLFGLAQ
jgi:hypothetical protein